jgi:Domain of unknown function (DUF1707)
MSLVGDRERDRACSVLRRHYADGRLELADLSGRIGIAASARTTEDVRAALSDLPNAWLEGEVVSRLLALRWTRAGTALAYRVRRFVLAAILAAMWLTASVMLLAALFVAEVVVGVGFAVAAGFAAVWLGATWLLWRAWRRGVR